MKPHSFVACQILSLNIVQHHITLIAHNGAAQGATIWGAAGSAGALAWISGELDPLSEEPLPFLPALLGCPAGTMGEPTLMSPWPFSWCAGRPCCCSLDRLWLHGAREVACMHISPSASAGSTVIICFTTIYLSVMELTESCSARVPQAVTFGEVSHMNSSCLPDTICCSV